MATRRIWQTLRRRIGHRGAALLFFGTLDLVYAWSMVSASDTLIQANPTLRWFSQVIGLEFWSSAWMVVGIICLYHAFQRYDRFGFVAAIGIKMTWGLGSLAGCIIEDVSLGSVAVWLGLAGLVWIISGWPEPPEAGEDVKL
jgi:hypothetical protein